jgi:hypothetical protein
VFYLKADGVNLKVVCESQGGYKNYTSSKFTLPKAIDGVTDKNIATILDGAYDLEKVFPVKSYDELKNLLDEHFLCSTDTADSEPIVAAVTEKNTKPSSQPVAAATGSTVDDDEVKRLLDGLDD